MSVVLRMFNVPHCRGLLGFGRLDRNEEESLVVVVNAESGDGSGA
jgi:hypothetical protein